MDNVWTVEDDATVAEIVTMDPMNLIAVNNKHLIRSVFFSRLHHDVTPDLMLTVLCLSDLFSLCLIRYAQD